MRPLPHRTEERETLHARRTNAASRPSTLAGLRAGCAFAALLCAAGCRRPPAPPIDTVVLISIDSLRADHVGVYGYGRPTTPTIDRLAASGILFDRAYSTTSWTLPAHVSLLTGRDDFAHGVIDDGHKIPVELETLPETLRRAGIETVGFFSAPYLHPSFGFGRGFDRYVNCTSAVPPERIGTPDPFEFLASYRDVTNPILLRKVRDWVKHQHAGRRTFLFIHMWDVHYDYIPPQHYVSLFDPDYSGALKPPYFGRVLPSTPLRDLQHIMARYDGEIRYTDDTLGRILKLLQRRRLTDRGAVIVLADHGEEFLEHGKQGHRWNLYEEVVRIPLVMAVAGRVPPSPRVDQVVSIVDVSPTICELFGTTCASDVPGRSLMRFFDGGRPVPARDDALAELTVPSWRISQVALIRREGKVIRWNDTGVTRYFDREAMRSERAGVVVDPGRMSEHDTHVREAVSQLERRLDQAKAAGKELYAGATDSAAHPDADTTERLRALGYIN